MGESSLRALTYVNWFLDFHTIFPGCPIQPFYGLTAEEKQLAASFVLLLKTFPICGYRDVGLPAKAQQLSQHLILNRRKTSETVQHYRAVLHQT